MFGCQPRGGAGACSESRRRAIELRTPSAPYGRAQEAPIVRYKADAEDASLRGRDEHPRTEAQAAILLTMPISFPPGQDRLPQGRHNATKDEIEQVLVNGFQNSTTRRGLFDQALELLDAIRQIVPVSALWIDGSFVTTKEDPGDIDLVSHLDGEALDALKPIDQMMLGGLISGHWSRDRSGCDSFAVSVYPTGHTARATYEATASWWDSFFGKDRAGNAKGYVELEIP
jgi:Family of unknown function (DUF6932)